MIAAQDKLASLKLDYDKMSRYTQQQDNYLKQLQVSEKKLEDECKALDAELAVAKWRGGGNVEMQGIEGGRKIYKKCRDYNQKARILRLIPSSEELAQGIDYEMQPSLEDTNSNHFKNTIKPALTQLRNQLMDKVNEVEEERIQTQSALEQVNDFVTDKQDTVGNLEDKLLKLEDKVDRQEKSHTEELSDKQLQIDQCPNHFI